ncbi:MAG: Ku protein, partial [Candidatus Eisenbacteria bacterium]
MARPFWKGTLSFGLVEIGVTLQPARTGDDLSFSLLDRRDFSPVGYKRYNKRTGKEVPWDSVVRGYEYEPAQYVVLTDDELRQANAEVTQTLDLVSFVDRSEIEPIYFDTPYFVLPLRKSSRGYSLLRDTLSATGLV